MRRAICLDRDGTVIHDVGYPREPSQVRLLPGVVAELAELQRRGFLLVLISNQSGVGRGLVAPEQADRVHARVVAELSTHGIHLDGAYYCPHAPEEGCACRKPAIGLLIQAAQELRFDLSRSYMVGDKPSDVTAGRTAGCRTVLLKSEGDHLPATAVADFIADDWQQAARWILFEGADAV